MAEIANETRGYRGRKSFHCTRGIQYHRFFTKLSTYKYSELPPVGCSVCAHVQMLSCFISFAHLSMVSNNDDILMGVAACSACGCARQGHVLKILTALTIQRLNYCTALVDRVCRFQAENL